MKSENAIVAKSRALHESRYIDNKMFDSIYTYCQEPIKILVSITKTQKY